MFALNAQSVQAGLARAGIDVQLIPLAMSNYYDFLGNPQNALDGLWDMAFSTIIPDWLGANNGRQVLADSFDGRRFLKGSGNFGGYNASGVNLLIDRALAAETPEEAAAAWVGVSSLAMHDAAIVPLIEAKFAWFHGPRVRNCVLDVTQINCSLNAVWLRDGNKR